MIFITFGAVHYTYRKTKAWSVRPKHQIGRYIYMETIYQI